MNASVNRSAPQERSYDAIVIGSGQGGKPLALALAKAGRRTALIERAHIGGTCVNVGCTPTKTMVASARVAYLARRSADYGVHVEQVTVRQEEVRRRKQAVVERFRSGSQKRLEEAENLDLLFGEAFFEGPRSLGVRLNDGGTLRLSSQWIFINVGCRPSLTGVKGIEGAGPLDSTSIMELDVTPSHLIVLGGGYVGVEFGQMFRRFGSRVTIVQRGGQLLAQEDPDVAAEVAKIPREDGIEVLLETQALEAVRSAGGSSSGESRSGESGTTRTGGVGSSGIGSNKGGSSGGTHTGSVGSTGIGGSKDGSTGSRTDGSTGSRGTAGSNTSAGGNDIRLTVRTPGGERVLEGSHLLAAAGRIPNTEQLGLAIAGVETDAKDFIVASEKLETSAPGVYAIGDVKGGPAFTHISYDDFRILRTNLLEGGNATTKGRLVPYTVFIDPQLGRVGLSETEARAQGRKIRVAHLPMDQVARAIEMGETRGFMKAVVDAESGEILGYAALGVEGGELMSMMEIAMMGRVPYTALRDGIFAHPTLAESLNNLFRTIES